jgi:hypothetical protein
MLRWQGIARGLFTATSRLRQTRRNFAPNGPIVCPNAPLNCNRCLDGPVLPNPGLSAPQPPGVPVEPGHWVEANSRLAPSRPFLF